MTLRERKKYQIRQQLKEAALRLFHDQGYEATTVEQIAACLPVSSRTFFRYFPAKEDVLFDDEHDTHIAAAFHAQPPHLSLFDALRNALQAAFSNVSATGQEYERQRHMIISATPELQMRKDHEFLRNSALLASLIAVRTGRDTDSLYVRTLANALVGVLIGAQNNSEDPLASMDEALQQCREIFKKE